MGSIQPILDRIGKLKYIQLRMILNNETSHFCTLGQLNPGERAEIVAFNFDGVHEDYFRRLLEIGFLVGVQLELLNEAPVSRNPISIKIKDATYALRREEADCIQVRKLNAIGKH